MTMRKTLLALLIALGLGPIPPADRGAFLKKIADVIDENAELFALQETLDNGKPIRETRAADVPLASDHFRYFASVIRGEEGTATQLDAEDLSIVLREPIGVVGQIIPWNFPFLMAAWKIAPALAAGCTIVIHPSSSTSLSLLSFAQKINHLLPKGVLNVITGRGSKSGEYMLHHKGFNKLAFTGSTEVGRPPGPFPPQPLMHPIHSRRTSRLVVRHPFPTECSKARLFQA